MTCNCSNGCSATTSGTVSQPSAVVASSSAGTIACNGGTTSVTVSATGGTGAYTGTGVITGQNAGSHTYTVTDANGCSASTTITISEPSQIVVSATPGTIACNGGTTSVTVSATGGTGAYTGTGVITGQNAGTHTYTVTDANG